MYFFLQKNSIPDLFIALDDTQNEVGLEQQKKQNDKKCRLALALSYHFSGRWLPHNNVATQYKLFGPRNLRSMKINKT